MQAAFSLQPSAFISWLHFAPLFRVPCIFKTTYSEKDHIRLDRSSSSTYIWFAFGFNALERPHCRTLKRKAMFYVQADKPIKRRRNCQPNRRPLSKTLTNKRKTLTDQGKQCPADGWWDRGRRLGATNWLNLVCAVFPKAERCDELTWSGHALFDLEA